MCRSEHKTIWFVDVVSAVLLFVFLYTALSKLAEHEGFLLTLKQVSLLAPFATVISRLLPVGELILVLLLFFPKTRRVGLQLSVLAILLFSLYILYLLILAPSLPCSCGGFISKLSWRQHLFLNFCLVTMGVAAVSVDKRKAILTNKNIPRSASFFNH